MVSATRNALEFASEVYAGVRTGQGYDEEVLSLYRFLLGLGGLTEDEL
jgi:hypothetical protein